MASKAFLDANFLLTITFERPGIQDVEKIMRMCINKEIMLFTSAAVLHITSYFTSQSITTEETKRGILVLLNDVQVIDCDHATALTAINSNFADIEDALQYFTALKHGVDYFISADKKLKKAAIPQLPVYTAAELLAELSA